MARIEVGGLELDYELIGDEGAPPLVLFRTVARSSRAWEKFRGGSLLDLPWELWSTFKIEQAFGFNRMTDRKSTRLNSSHT